MTHKEAADIIEEYAAIHRAPEISEAFRMAIILLRQEEAREVLIQKGTPVQYVDYDFGEVEEGEVFSVQYKNGYIETLAVNFKSGDFDEFIGESVGRYLFFSEDVASSALISGCNLKD